MYRETRISFLQIFFHWTRGCSWMDFGPDLLSVLSFVFFCSEVNTRNWNFAFFESQHGVRDPCEIVCDSQIFWEKSCLGKKTKNDKKRP